MAGKLVHLTAHLFDRGPRRHLEQEHVRACLQVTLDRGEALMLMEDVRPDPDGRRPVQEEPGLEGQRASHHLVLLQHRCHGRRAHPLRDVDDHFLTSGPTLGALVVDPEETSPASSNQDDRQGDGQGPPRVPTHGRRARGCRIKMHS